AHIQCLLSVVLTAQVPNFTSLFMADDAGKISRTVAGIKGADFRSSLSKTCIVSCNRQVANNMQHMSAANRITCNHCHYRLRNDTDQTLQIQYVQARNLVIAYIASM